MTVRSAQITFSGGEKLRVEIEDAKYPDTRKFADALVESNEFLFLARNEGGHVFVNGREVAFVEDWPN